MLIDELLCDDSWPKDFKIKSFYTKERVKISKLFRNIMNSRFGDDSVENCIDLLKVAPISLSLTSLIKVAKILTNCPTISNSQES